MTVKHATQTAKANDPTYDVSADEWNEAHTVTNSTATITTGNTYVDKAHGLASTPDIEDIHVTPHDNLGGRSFWISNVGAATFRINISSQDLQNHVFGYIIV